MYTTNDIPNEEERIRALMSYQIMDTPPETLFDDITELASDVCDVPIALISLIADDRQWFKSKIGLSVYDTPRDISFCNHVIKQKDVFEVPNSLKDERFHDNPLVIGEPKIVFYAGTPLIDEDGHALGTLCVVDHVKKRLSSKQKNILKKLARQVMTQLHLRKSNLQLSDNIKQTREIQAKLIHSSKMASLGEMAAGMAHEINNPLSIIIGYANVLELLSEKNEKLKSEVVLDNCREIEQTCLRISAIVNALKRHSGTNSENKVEQISFSDLVKDAISLCQEKFKSRGVNIHLVDHSPQEKIKCRPIEISQVLVNLLNNSSDAILGDDSAWIKIEHISSEESTFVSVADSGKRIPDKVADQMFEPFFTTKASGHGTGLGLGICLGIVKSHGGHIVYDRKSENSKFILKIPKNES